MFGSQVKTVSIQDHTIGFSILLSVLITQSFLPFVHIPISPFQVLLSITIPQIQDKSILGNNSGKTHDLDCCYSAVNDSRI